MPRAGIDSGLSTLSETACDLYAISSIIVGVGVNASNCATKLSVDIDLELLTEVYSK